MRSTRCWRGLSSSSRATRTWRQAWSLWDRAARSIVKGLEPAPEGKDYQLWLLGDEAPVSGGTFDAEDGFIVLPTDLDAADFSGAAVSVEPDGGSEGPTTEPFLVSGG